MAVAINMVMITMGENIVYKFTDNPLRSIIGYLFLLVISIILVASRANPVSSFIGFIGVSIALGITIVLTVNTYNISAIYRGLVMTAIVTIVFMILGALLPDLFMSLGPVLFGVLLLVLAVRFILHLIGMDYTVIETLIIMVFCGFVAADIARANTITPTICNAIHCACDLYLDVVNIFVRFVRLAAKSK